MIRKGRVRVQNSETHVVETRSHVRTFIIDSSSPPSSSDCIVNIWSCHLILFKCHRCAWHEDGVNLCLHFLPGRGFQEARPHPGTNLIRIQTTHTASHYTA